MSILKQGTYALEHGPHLRDAVHGLITKRTEKYLPGLTWRPVSDKIVEPGAWSQVFWRKNRWAGAANREDGDYSSRADLVAFVDEVCRWRVVDEQSSEALEPVGEPVVETQTLGACERGELSDALSVKKR